MSSASSPLFLSLATIFALLGIVLVAVALGTNDWQKFTVQRQFLLDSVNRLSQGERQKMDTYLSKYRDIGYTRTYGLFKECFPTNDLPQDLDTHTTPLGGTCISRKHDYQIPEDTKVTSRYSSEEVTRMHLLRAQVAFYVTGVAILFICLVIGVAGCWKRSSSIILTAGILLLFSTLFFAGSMAIWHGVDYLQMRLIETAPYFKDWPQLLVDVTEKPEYGWSYMVSWIGIGFILISAVMMLVAYRAMKEEEWVSDKQPYMMPPGAFYDKGQMAPYGTGYGYGYPPQAGFPSYGYPQYGTNAYAGYLTYGR